VQDRHPAVYVKSRAKGFENGEEIRVTITAAGPDDASARRLVEAGFHDVRSGLAALGIAILPSP
ncbi:MAG: hypothetical protein ACRDKS_05050, partial [Actinomycetota bacterium]